MKIKVIILSFVILITLLSGCNKAADITKFVDFEWDDDVCEVTYYEDEENVFYLRGFDIRESDCALVRKSKSTGREEIINYVNGKFTEIKDGNIYFSRNQMNHFEQTLYKYSIEENEVIKMYLTDGRTADEKTNDIDVNNLGYYIAENIFLEDEIYVLLNCPYHEIDAETYLYVADYDYKIKRKIDIDLGRETNIYVYKNSIYYNSNGSLMRFDLETQQTEKVYEQVISGFEGIGKGIILLKFENDESCFYSLVGNEMLCKISDEYNYFVAGEKGIYSQKQTEDSENNTTSYSIVKYAYDNFSPNEIYVYDEETTPTVGEISLFGDKVYIYCDDYTKDHLVYDTVTGKFIDVCDR